jgi:hypothetical protein
MKWQIVQSMVVATAITLCVLLGVIVVFLVVISEQTVSDTQDALIAQATGQMAGIVFDGRQALDEDLNRFAGFVASLATVTSWTDRPDYPFGLVPSYMDDPSTLPQPLTYSALYGANINPNHISYHVPNATPASRSTFSAALNNTLSRTVWPSPQRP